MSDAPFPEHLRNQVKQSLRYYAKFYAELTHENTEAAEEALGEIEKIDEFVAQRYPEENYEGYLERRTRLMRIFHLQLMERIQGEVEQEIFLKAEQLIEKFQVPSTL
ncbi:hypothetical protein MRY87_13720 [bacterium]|nr:hypothetical protein [bacterium]